MSGFDASLRKAHGDAAYLLRIRSGVRGFDAAIFLGAERWRDGCLRAGGTGAMLKEASARYRHVAAAIRIPAHTS